jgi:hypothetical protein
MSLTCLLCAEPVQAGCVIDFIKKTLSTTATPNTQISAYREEARRKYFEFLKTDFMAQKKDAAEAEVLHLRTLPNDAERVSYLKKEADLIVQKIQKKYGTTNIGFHYNLHGGRGQDYVDGGGLKISRGDISVQYGGGALGERIYLFQSSKTNLFDILNSENPSRIFGGRMGSDLNIFNLDHAQIQRAKKENGIVNFSDIFMEFDPAWVAKQEWNAVDNGRVGIPYETYLVPPMRVFTDLKKRYQGIKKLSRHEETLLTLREIEAALLSDQTFVPTPVLPPK